MRSCRAAEVTFDRRSVEGAVVGVGVLSITGSGSLWMWDSVSCRGLKKNKEIVSQLFPGEAKDEIRQIIT